MISKLFQNCFFRRYFSPAQLSRFACTLTYTYASTVFAKEKSHPEAAVGPKFGFGTVSPIRISALCAVAMVMAGCADTPLLSGKKAPDELAVIEGPPLYLPPSFDVRPPSEMNPTLAKEASTEEKAQEIITGNKSAPAAEENDADWLVKRAGGDGRDATIRTRLEAEEKARQEVKKEKDNRGFFSRVFGGDDDSEPKVDEAGRVILDQSAPDAGSYQKQ